jgi:hypothetical protein
MSVIQDSSPDEVGRTAFNALIGRGERKLKGFFGGEWCLGIRVFGCLVFGVWCLDEKD